MRGEGADMEGRLEAALRVECGRGEMAARMADPFNLWRLAWSTAVAGAFDQLAGSLPRPDAVAPPGTAEAFDLTGFPVIGRVRLELATMRLLEQREPVSLRGPPTLIVAPYAVHDASIADLAVGHSIAETLAASGLSRIALTFWKSATVDMRDYGIDAYLSDLNVAVDDLGGPARLVGLCQGGWLAAAYAARFPRKVAKLALAGAPIDPAAAESGITRALAAVSPAMISQLVAFSGGRILGAASSTLWAESLVPEFNAEAALQGEEDPAIVARFDAWNARTVDLPGVFFRQTSEWVFREQRLARGAFPALGRLVRLEDITCPIFVVAAADDEVVPPPQTLAIKRLCPRTQVEIRVAPGRHLSQFMGRRTLSVVWPEVARWLAAKTNDRRTRRLGAANGQREGSADFLADGFEVGGDVEGFRFGQARRGHGVAGNDPLRVVDPGCEVLGRVSQKTSDEDPAAHEDERRADETVSALNAGNHVAGAAAVSDDEFDSPVRRARRKRLKRRLHGGGPNGKKEGERR